MKYFCTFFDRNFLVRGLALHRSLRQHGGNFQLWVLCFDNFTFDVLHKLNAPDLVPISIHEFEAANPEVKRAEKSRSRVEYFFTCTPSVPFYVLKKNPEVDVVTYVDADLYFYSDPEPLFREMADKSILIIEHRFPPAQRELEKYGRFNVGFLSFRNDKSGRRCLEDWRNECIEWCFDRLEGDRYADQKYLDRWAARYNNVVVSRLKGANVAPWNVFQYSIRLQDAVIKVDEQDLIFYHFHQLKMVTSWICDPGLWRYGGSAGSRQIRRYIYLPYLQGLKATREELLRLVPELHDMQRPSTALRYGLKSALGSATHSLLRGELLFDLRGFGY